MDPVKVQGVTDWPQPMKVKDIQSFIGFVNFYQRFIWNFSEITHPLHTLTWKLKDWLWGTAEQQAFNALKNAVTLPPCSPSPLGPASSAWSVMHPTSPWELSCCSNK